MAICLDSEDLETYIAQYGNDGGIARLSFLAKTALKHVKDREAYEKEEREKEEDGVEIPNIKRLCVGDRNEVGNPPSPQGRYDDLPPPPDMRPIAVDAHRVLLDILKRTSNTKLYVQIIEQARELSVNYAADTLWLETTDKQNNHLHDAYEQDLNSAKTSQSKHAIRTSQINFANFWMERGEYFQALKHFLKAREYHSDLNISMTMLKLNAFLCYYPEVQSYASKLHAASAESSVIAASQGLFYLGTAKYRDAAVAFQNAHGNIDELSEVMSPLDVCVYTSMLALATLDRQELNKLMENSVYQERLSSLPVMNSIVQNFVTCRYGLALKELSTIRYQLGLDLHLAPHVHFLCNAIRQKAITRFFLPFECVSLRAIATAFHTSVEKIHEEVAILIGCNQIAGKIDSQKQVLYMRKTNERLQAFKKAIEVGGDMLQSTRAMVLRVNLMKYDFVSKGSLEESDDKR